MSNRSLTVLATIAAIVVVFTALTFRNNQLALQNNSGASHYSAYSNEITTPITEIEKTVNLDEFPFNNHDYAKNVIAPKEGQSVKKFTLTAKEVNLEVKSDVTIPVWTYNGKVPGEEIRVTQGDFVQVELKNDLKVPVTIHWHGYPLKSAMDGVPGLNQDAVKPGETFTYQFSADVAGTYWYHSHQESSEQVDKGLYGALIVEPKDKGNITKDFTLILDEWMSSPMEEMGGMSGMNMGGDNKNSSMPGMNMPKTSKEPADPVMEEEDMMAYAYDIYTVNGKSGELVKPLEVKKGDVVRLRFINAGYRSHGIHIPGQDIRVISTDGQNINEAGIIKDQIIMMAPGERYDIEFTVSSDESFVIDAHDDNGYNDQLLIPVNVVDGNGTVREEEIAAEYPIFDLFNYGVATTSQFTLEQGYDVNQEVVLGTDTSNGLKYTINGKTFGELPNLKLKTGDTVKLTYYNNSKVNHPMHLHGHFFQVLSKDGVPLTGAPIIKDTLMVKPGERYVVALKADNTGKWVQHCHELHHAAGGMMQGIEYTDFQSNYTPDPKNTFNKPE